METFSPTFAGLQALVARLRGPEGCPWDREQTGATMRHFVLEETYELLEAIDGGDPGLLTEELGDVMFHLAFHIHMAKEKERFDETDVFNRSSTSWSGVTRTSSETQRPLERRTCSTTGRT